MQFLIDTHTHTLSSGHAYSTIIENAMEAKKKGIEYIAMTDHGPALEGAPSRLFFLNLRVIPESIHGVRILKGIECNILDHEGALDLELYILKRMEFVLASLHDICIRSSSIHNNTKALLKALENPYVDVIAHPDNAAFPIDKEAVVIKAKELGKLLEINNQSFVVRKGSEENCRELIRLCKKHNTPVICGSDAHISFDIGNFSNIIPIFEEEQMPNDLILNTSIERFQNYLKTRNERIQNHL